HALAQALEEGIVGGDDLAAFRLPLRFAQSVAQELGVVGPDPGRHGILDRLDLGSIAAGAHLLGDPVGIALLERDVHGSAPVAPREYTRRRSAATRSTSGLHRLELVDQAF